MSFQLVRTTSGLLYSSEFASLSDWTHADAAYSVDTTRPVYISRPSPLVVLSGGTIGSSSDGSGPRDCGFITINGSTQSINQRWYVTYDGGNGNNSGTGSDWAINMAYSDDRGLTWTKLGALTVNNLPGGFATATSGEFFFFDGTTWHYSPLAPSSYVNGIPAGVYHSFNLTAPAITGPYTYQSESPTIGGTGAYNCNANYLCWAIFENGGWTGFSSCGTTQTASPILNWAIARCTASTLAGPWTMDGQADIVSPRCTSYTLFRPENPRVWFSSQLNKWVMSNNSVDSTANFTCANDLLYAPGSNAWGLGTPTLLATDAFNETAGAPAAPWQTSLVNGFPVLTGSALNMGNTVGASIIYRTDQSVADSVQQADFNLGTNCAIGFIFRYQDSNNFYHCDVQNIGPPAVVALFKVVAGTETQIGSNISIASSYFSTNTYITCKVALLGNLFAFYVNGNQIGTFTDSSITAAGGVGLRNGQTGTANRLVQNYSWNSLSDNGVYHQRAQRLVPLDSTTQLAIGFPAPLHNETGGVIQDSSGRVPYMYDGDPPSTFNSAANSPSYHRGRRLRAAVFTPHPTCLFANTSSVAYLLQNQPASSFTAEMTFAFLSSTGTMSFCWWMSGVTDSTTVGYTMTVDTGARTVTIYSRNAGTVTSLGSANLVALTLAQDTYNMTTERIKLVVNASTSTYTVYYDSDPSTPILTVTDSSLSVGPQMGFRAGASTNCRVYSLTLRTSDTVTINGLPASQAMRLRLAGWAYQTGTTVGGTDTIAAAHYPMGTFDLNGTDAVSATGDIWGGDVYTYQGQSAAQFIGAAATFSKAARARDTRNRGLLHH